MPAQQPQGVWTLTRIPHFSSVPSCLSCAVCVCQVLLQLESTDVTDVKPPLPLASVAQDLYSVADTMFDLLPCSPVALREHIGAFKRHRWEGTFPVPTPDSAVVSEIKRGVTALLQQCRELRMSEFTLCILTGLSHEDTAVRMAAYRQALRRPEHQW